MKPLNGLALLVEALTSRGDLSLAFTAEAEGPRHEARPHIGPGPHVLRLFLALSDDFGA